MKVKWVGLEVLLVLVGVTAFGGPIGLARKASTPAEVAFQNGVELASRKDFAHAAAAYRESLRLNPKQGLAWAGLADLDFLRKNWKGAEANFRKAIASDPKNPGIQEAWGRFLFELGRAPESIGPLRAAAQGAPDNAGVRFALGDALMRGARNPAEAAKAYQEGLKLDPAHPGGNFGLGMALRAQGKRYEARKSLEKAADLALENPLPHQALGEMAIEDKKPDEALMMFNAALMQNRNFLPARLSRGDVYFQRGDFANALTEYQDARRIRPTAAGPVLKAALCQQMMKNRPAARRLYQEALKLDQNLALAYNNLAWMAVEDNQGLNQAANWAKRATQLAPKVTDFQDTLGWVLFRQGAAAEALPVLRAAASGQANASTFYHLGCVAQKLGQKAEARQAFERALQLNRAFPEAADTRQRLAQVR